MTIDTPQIKRGSRVKREPWPYPDRPETNGTVELVYDHPAWKAAVVLWDSGWRCSIAVDGLQLVGR